MKLTGILSICALVALFFGVFAEANGQNNYRISAPVSYKNLTIFLIHGKNLSDKKNILTLQEAMERDLFIVYETSNVNKLAVENISKEFDVFIQSGDIVKGGKQDRVLAISIIIPANSGRVLIDSFCVESGRWQQRGGEDAGKFSSSNDRIVTKDLKIAANQARSQQEVWSEVSEAQRKLSDNVGGTVNSGVSATSLQLSLENKKVQTNIDEYIKKLSNTIDGKSDVIGYAFAINGEINSADVYVSNSLFKKLWLKMLKASAIEAVAEFDEKKKIGAIKADQIKTFLADADKGKVEEKASTKQVRIIARESEKDVVFEAIDEKSKVVVHKNYVKKNQ